MATATGRFYCVTCKEDRVAYKCEGCSQYFCIKHLTIHHQSVVDELAEVENKRNLLQGNLNDHKTDPKKHFLIQRINQWKQDSIKKIEQTAKECEELLGKALKEHIDKIGIKLGKFTGQLIPIRKENDVNEIVLKKLIEELKQLEEELNKPPNISIQQDSSSFINKISVIISFSKFI